MRLLLLLGLIASSSPAADAPDPHLALAKTIGKDSRLRAICGEFATKEGLVEGLVFADGDTVKTRIGGLEATRRYFIQGRTVFILLDKDLLVMDVNDSNGLLVGKDGMVLGKKLKRVGRDATCAPYPTDDASARRLAKELCYIEGTAIQRGDPAKAAEHYLQCCEKGGAISCNKYGFLKALKGDAKTGAQYFKKACDGGYGGGCSNLADAELKAGRKREALALFKKACDSGYRDACLKVASEGL